MWESPQGRQKANVQLKVPLAVARAGDGRSHRLRVHGCALLLTGQG